MWGFVLRLVRSSCRRCFLLHRCLAGSVLYILHVGLTVRLLFVATWQLGFQVLLFSSVLADCCRVSSENSVTKVKPPSSHCPGGHNGFGSAAMTVFSDGRSVSANLVTGLVVGGTAAQNLFGSRKQATGKRQHGCLSIHVNKHTLAIHHFCLFTSQCFDVTSTSAFRIHGDNAGKISARGGVTRLLRSQTTPRHDCNPICERSGGLLIGLNRYFHVGPLLDKCTLRSLNDV